MKFYKASLDRLSVVITAGVAVLFLVIGFIPSFLSGNNSEAGPPVIVMALINLFNGSILLCCYLFHTTGYSLTSEELIINRPAKNKAIPISKIKEIKSVPREDLKWSVRTFGNGGVFGYFGKFYNSRFGSMTWYAANRNHFIMILLNDGKKIVITPDDMSIAEKIINSKN